MKASPAATWGAATIMVTIVSCCSLIGLSIVPLISGTSYKTFNTLFTGLAVGSLTGSAIFSLIPQAFGLFTQEDKGYLYKSMFIFVGIYLFYCSERLMRIYFERRSQTRDKMSQKPQEESCEQTSKTGPENVASETAGDTSKGDNEIDAVPMTEISLAKDHAKIDHHHHHHHNTISQHEVIARALKGEAQTTPVKVIAPVAWMIIIGDGLHNLIDGLSIGAAFTESLRLGFSTSLAVIFEELPHELGDFAVLVASGMSVRQAVMFNFLSACTCYIGMVAGLVLGDLTSSASYIFALAGGMFLYISLVDMMGELSAMLEEVKHSPKESTHLLFMQNIGILLGILIIFILCMYSNA